MRQWAALLMTVWMGASVPAMAADAAYVRKDELDKLIKAYLMKHPEVIIEAVQTAQKNEQDQAVAEAKKAVKSNRKAIFDNPNSASIGKKDAAVTVVQFFDYNCSACKYMFKAIDQLKQEGLQGVRVVFKEFPIFGEQSENLARLALAVNQLYPEKFYDYYTGLMKISGHIDEAQAKEVMTKLGLDASKVQQGADSPGVRAMLAEERALGHTLGIGGTPFLIINDRVIPSALDYAALKAEIAKAKPL